MLNATPIITTPCAKRFLDEQQIINDMNEALQSKQFEVYLQPKCVLSTGEIIGAEALVRWNHPTRGLLMPGAFVPLFEKNGFIMKMDAYVWESVFALMRKWMDPPRRQAAHPAEHECFPRRHV